MAGEWLIEIWTIMVWGRGITTSLMDIATWMTDEESDDKVSSDDDEINKEITIYNSDSV